MGALLFILASFPPAHAVTSDVPLPAPIANQNYHLARNWDFAKNILTLDDLRHEFYTRYSYDNGTGDHLNDEWQVYREHDNHEISNGALHLIARDPSGVIQKGAIESGMIRAKWTSQYGYYEARMKVPAGRGMWPAFWFANVVWPPEIDIMEIVNNGKEGTTRNSYHNLHGKYTGDTLSSRLNKDGTYIPGFDYAEGFHIFAIEWTPTTVKHYVDNVLVVERQFLWRDNNGHDGAPTPLVINLAVGGHWPGAPTDAAEFPQSLDVSYIRVWQKY